MNSDSEIPKCQEVEVKSKIGKLLMNEKVLEESSVKIHKIDPNKNWKRTWNNVLFRV